MTLTEKTLQDYAYYLSLERNLSPHTRASYLSDLNAFFSLVPKEPVEVVSGDIVDYLTEISDLLSKRSQARLLSALRSFFTWMTLEGDRPDNPCDGIDTPKLGRYLPEVLSVEEVEAILESVDLSKRFGRRDRAILEVLYGCGLRVSELTDLQVSHVYLDEGFVRVVGKGNKERLVPLGEMAAQAIRAYLEVREEPDRGFEDILFLNKDGRALSRISVFNLVKKPPDRKRRRPAGGAGNAGTRIHPHHGNLYPYRFFHLAALRAGTPSAQLNFPFFVTFPLLARFIGSV